MTRRFSPILLFLLVLLLEAPLCESAAYRRSYSLSTNEVEATVLTLRRYETGTYMEVLRDDGLQEWIEINREEGLDVRSGQRIAYTPISPPHEHYMFGRLRTGHYFRILPQEQGDQPVYQGRETDGAMIFTDNPKENMRLKEPSGDGPGNENRKPQKKGAKGKDREEIIVVTPEQLLIEKEMTDEYYRYLERSNTGKPVRRAKKAMPKPVPYAQ